MKNLTIKVITFLIFNLFVNSHLYSQTSESVKNRIIEIKKWYAEINAMGLKNCKSKSYQEYEKRWEDWDGEAHYSEHTQTISVCRLNDAYELRKGQFQGHEWYEDILIYSKNGKIFFVFEKGGGEGGSWEKRYYCNTNEKIIQQLDREANVDEELNNPNKENKSNINKNIHEFFDLNKVKRIQNE
jgi:hypothetical protein